MKKEKKKLKIKNVGKNIKFFRKLANLSSLELSEKAGISYTYMKRVEANNDSAPGLDTLLSIALALDVPVDFLIKDSEYKIFTDFSNYIMSERLKNLSEEQYKLYTETLTLLYEHVYKNT